MGGTRGVRPFLKVTEDGTEGTTGAASANVLIPNNAAGQTARYVRIAVASGAAYFLPGNSSVVATAKSILVTAEDSILLDVAGSTHIAHIQNTAGVDFTISPVEHG